MSQYSWPDPSQRNPCSAKRISRVDGPAKSSGRAKYTYDYNPDGMLAGKIVRCPYAHAKIKSIDTSAAEKMPGVKAVEIIQKPGTEIFWAGDEIVGVAAVDESTAEDAVRAIKVRVRSAAAPVSDAEPPKNIAPATGPISSDDFRGLEENQVPDDEVIAAIQQARHQLQAGRERLQGDGRRGCRCQSRSQPCAQPRCCRRRARSRPTSAPPCRPRAIPTRHLPRRRLSHEGLYGVPCIVHCCLESHGSVSEWSSDNELTVHISTQNVSGIAPQMAEPAGSTRQQHSRTAAEHRRRLRQQVRRRPLGHRRGQAFQVCRRQAGEDDAGARRRIRGRRHAALRLRAREDRRRQETASWSRGNRIPGALAEWAAAARLPSRTSLKFPISASRTPPSPPTRAAPAPGARPTIRKRR